MDEEVVLLNLFPSAILIVSVFCTLPLQRGYSNIRDSGDFIIFQVYHLQLKLAQKNTLNKK